MPKSCEGAACGQQIAASPCIGGRFGQAPYLPGEVAKNVLVRQTRNAGALVDISANHGDAIGVRILCDWQDLVAHVTACRWIETVRAFHHIPAEVPALL